MTVECEDCGHEIPVSKSDFAHLPDTVICSTCDAKARYEYRLKRMRENHTPRPYDDNGRPIRIPPMIHIDTRDLPGFARDNAAKRIGETLSLFKKD